MKKKTINKFLRGLSVFCVLLVFYATSTTLVFAETAAEKYQRLKAELAEISNQIDAYKNDKAAAQALKEALITEKALVDEMIAINKQSIADTEVALAAKQEEVALKRQAIYENDQLFQERLVAIYTMNNSSMLSQLLSVDDFSELMRVNDALQRISQHDTDLLELLAQQRAELETQQAEIDAMLVSLNEQYTELATNAQHLADNIVAQDARISAADAALIAEQEAYDDTYAALVQAQREMAAIASRMGGSKRGDGSQYVGGVFTWPVPGFYNISCNFGSPDPNGSAHRGTDVSGGGISGATIVACGSGTVITASYAHYSYGNYVIIDHGNGVKTLYAHCSSLLVSPGEGVSTGQPIATVGSTGFSTGPHLHLEVHDGGVLQNPLGYLRG